jgi:L-asparaginase/Glu-tRNA(Gln) amidotransferase subunit D
MSRRTHTPSLSALIVTALVLGAVGGIETWADNDLPRVKFLATGGTIATRG